MNLFSRALSSGATLEIRAADDAAALVAYVDGKEAARGSFFDGVYDVRRTPAQLSQMPVTPTGERTTHIACGKFALTTSEGEALAAKVVEVRRQREEQAAAALEAAVPGLSALRAAQTAVREDGDRYDAAFAAMMDDGDNDGARPPAPESPSLREKAARLADLYPRAALYLRAEAQSRSAHWSDNTGKGAAGDEAMRLLRDGASEDDARAALARRRTVTD